MYPFKRSMLSLALASALQAMAGGAQAEVATAADAQQPVADAAGQTQDKVKKSDKTKKAIASSSEDNNNQEIETVSVTGIRLGIERAIDTKRSSDKIVEAISAEDIGKLPDASIAESIARLPGLTAQRVAGRASTIQIRGLADDFGTALLNGREQVSVGQNRGVEFDQYPSELMSGVTVYKTADASLVGQGLSGTVNLQTVRPLQYDKRVVVVNARGEKNSNGKLNPGSDDKGNRVSFSYIDQFMDHTLGVAIGFAHLDSPGQAQRWEAWGYPSVTIDGQDAYLLGGSKSKVSSTDNVRNGVMAVVEYKPSDTYKSTLDAYYSKFKADEHLRTMETGLGWSGASLSNAVVEDGAVVSGTFTGVRPVLRNDLNTRDDKILALGWKNEFNVGDNWTGFVDVAHSKAERDEMLLETYAGLGHVSDPTATDTVNFTVDPSGHPYFNYGRDYTNANQVVLTDPGGWNQDGFVKYPHVEDRLNSFRLDATRTFDDGMFKSVEFGVNYSDRKKTRESGFEGYLRLATDTLAIPSDILMSPVDLGFTGISGSIAYDPRAAMSLYNIQPLVHQDVLNKNWTVEEKLTTYFTQLNLDTDWGDVRVTGNVGLQLVHTDQRSKGLAVAFGDANDPVAMSGGTTYNELLPSMNLNFALTDDQVVRLGLGRQMARPRMDDMRANRNVDIRFDRDPTGEWKGDGGNPELKPWLANSADLSYEYYFGERGYVSVAGFYKDLRTYIYNQTVLQDFSNYDPSPFNPSSTLGEYSEPKNGSGGTLKGYEVALSVPFDLIAEPLHGFGLQASYSNTDSSIKPLGPDGGDEPLPGLSDEVSNITLYYEDYGFSARVSQRHRSDFLGEVQGFGADRSKRYIKGEDVVDMQIGYTFPEGSYLEGLSLLLQINNVTNEPYREYLPDNANLPQTYDKYGRTTLLGASYRF